MNVVRILVLLSAGAALLIAPVASGAVATSGSLPTRPDQMLFVGDSMTAGMYFFALCDEYAEQGWAGQLMRRFGMPPDRTRLPAPYPLDQLALTREGFGIVGWRYPWHAIPALRGRHSLFEGGEPRSIVAVPGQTLAELLRQSSEHHESTSVGWVLAARLLPPGRSTIETAELSARDPEWVFLFVGGNDALSFFRMIGSVRPPAPGAFARDYLEAVSRLRRVMRTGAPASQLFVATIPDVSRLPLLQPVPVAATDERGEPLPAGTVTSAFLAPRRGMRFERTEVWTPDQLDEIRGLVARYNEAIRDIAARHGHTVLDVAALSDELAQDPRFGRPDSPYFSPDLHHPSSAVHRRIAELAAVTMGRLAGEPVPPAPAPSADVPPPPDVGQLTVGERDRADALMRVALLAGQAGHFPPRPTARLGVEVAGGLGSDRIGDASVALLGQLESAPAPVTSHWVSRGLIGLRAGAGYLEGDRVRIPPEALDVRLGIAFEPRGHWRWKRAEVGARYGWAGGASWYARGEWSRVRLEVGGSPLLPERIELGLGLTWLGGRPGRNGN